MPRKDKYPVRGLERRGRESWRWQRIIEGRRHRVTFKAQTEAEAIATALEFERRPDLLQAGAWAFEVECYISQAQESGRLSAAYGRSRRTVLLKAGTDMGVAAPAELTEARVRAWYADTLEGRGGETANHYLAHLSIFARWLVKGRKIYGDPTAGVEKVYVQKATRDRFVPAEEVAQLIEAARGEKDPELELMLLLGFECGMRHGEISAAAAEWVDLERGLLTVPADEGEEGFRRKGRRGRRRAVTLPLVASLREWFETHGVPEPFLLRPDIGWGKFQYRYEFRKKIERFFRAQGYGDLRIHDMRRSFGSNRVSAGVSIEKVANWMGIHPATAWKHYARFIPADAEIERGAAAVGSGEAAEKAAVGGGDLVARLEQVRELLEAGLISEEEAEAKRAEVLRGV